MKRRALKKRYGHSHGLTFYAFDSEAKRAWKFHPSLAWYRRHDNGVAVSIGFRVPSEVTEAQLKKLGAKEVSYEVWKHSGCQSSCVLRGGTKCSW